LDILDIKSAATFTPDFLKGIERFRRALGGRCSAGIVKNRSSKITLPFQELENTGTDHHLTAFKNSFSYFLIERSYLFKESCLVNRSHLADNHNTRFWNISQTFS